MTESAANLRAELHPSTSEGPLVERGPELAALTQALESARDSRGSVVAIEGLSGSGRSRLLTEACRLGQQAGMEVLSAGARALERKFSLGVARQLLEGQVTRMDNEERKRLFAGPASLAAPLMLEGRSGPRASSGGEVSLSVAHGLYWVCSNLAAVRPMVLAVDDADCADEASLRFLLYLTERMRGLPVALIVTVGVGDSRSDLVLELVGHPVVRVLRLQPLSAAATARHLRGSRFPEADLAFTRAVHAASGGNPCLLDRLGVELERTGVRPTASSVEIVRRLGPASIAESTLRRLRRTGLGAVELARAVAVLGEAELHHAAELADLELADAAHLAHALEDAGILRPGPLLCFAQPVLGNALNFQASDWELAERHLRAARMLDREGAPTETVAVHLVRARPASDARAVEVLCTAADAALAKGTPDSAVRFLRRALREPPEPRMRARVVLKLGRAEATAGAAGAVEHLSEAARLIEDPVERASMALDLGGALYSAGRPKEAAGTLEQGPVALNRADASLTLRLRAARAVVTGTSLSRHELESVTAGKELQRDGNAAVDGVPLAHLAYERALQGEDAPAVRSLARHALTGGGLLEQSIPLGAGPAHALDYYRAIAALIVVEDLQVAERALNAAVERARASGSVLEHANARYLRAWTRLRRGRIDDAAADAHSAHAAMRRGWRMAVPGVHAVLAETAIERGLLGEAARHIVLGGGEHPRIDESLPLYLAAAGHTRLLRGRAAEALDAYHRCGCCLTERNATGPGIVAWRQGAAAAHYQLGNERQARLLLDEELERARRFGVPGSVGRALHATGAITCGDARLERLSEAVEVLERSEAVLDYARALVDLGGALRRAGKRRESRAHLLMGLEQANRCGARALSERARTEIAAAGGRPRRTALSGLGALTARERQVAGLAARGMSNREIADALFVTVKTVEWHLHNAYKKVEVTSRRGLRAVLPGPDLEPPGA